MLRYLLDENLRSAGLWRAILQHNARGVNPIDVVRVGDPPDLPRGSLDPEILLWAERADRILVTLDRHTIPVHLANHLLSGHHSPGVFVIQRGHKVSQVVFWLALAAYASDPAEWRDGIDYTS